MVEGSMTTCCNQKQLNATMLMNMLVKAESEQGPACEDQTALVPQHAFEAKRKANLHVCKWRPPNIEVQLQRRLGRESPIHHQHVSFRRLVWNHWKCLTAGLPRHGECGCNEPQAPRSEAAYSPWLVS